MANTPLYFFPDAIPTEQGWAHPLTGELLSAKSGLDDTLTFYRRNGNRFAFIDNNAGKIESLTITDAGTGYDPENPPSVTITGTGTGATATATVNEDGEVSELTVTNPGRGYTGAVTVTIDDPADPGDTTATATATLTSGTFVKTLVNAVITGRKVEFALFLQDGYDELDSVTFDPDDGEDPIEVNSNRFEYTYAAAGAYEPTVSVVFKAGTANKIAVGDITHQVGEITIA